MFVGGMKLYDEVVSGTVELPVTSDAMAKKLAMGDKLAVQAIVTGVTGTSPTLTVRLYDSADGSNYFSKNVMINGQSLTAGAKNDIRGYDTDTRPMLSFSRVTVQLGGTGNPSAHVQLFAVGRDV
jgi:hypothetical protein